MEMPSRSDRPAADYLLVAEIIRHIEDSRLEQPKLEELAAIAGLSPFHFQRLFTRWVGISPKRFLQVLTVEHAKKMLSLSRPVLQATFDAGLSSPGRLHDLFVTLEAVTPGEYKNRGKGLEIRYGMSPCPFGYAFIAVSPRGICRLSFHDRPEDPSGFEELASEWGESDLVFDSAAAAEAANAVFERISTAPHRLYVKGTNFQVQVWRALLMIPDGGLATYGDISRLIGKPGASRAVGSAVGANPVSYLIPCHRVITSLGITGNYRWGPVRKRAMIARESVSAAAADDMVFD